MQIVTATVEPCTQRLRDPSWKFARATVPQLEGHVLVLTDELGTRGLGYVHAIPAITTHGAGAQAALALLAPMLVGRRVDDLAALMEEIDAVLAFNPSVKAGIDMALHDLLARRLGVPVHVLLGGRLRDSVAQSRILPIKTPTEMAAKAADLAEEGYRQLKLKLSGDTSLDVARIAAVRDAAGPGVKLTLDPNQSYDAKQMMGAFARMERYDIALIEQPVPAADWNGLALLTRTLPVAIEADESAQTVQDVFRLVAERACDVINLKITKLGGLRRFMQAVRICEAGNVGCRVGAAFGPSLLQAMGMQAASVVRALPFACELSEHLHLLDDPFTTLAVDKGSIDVPRLAGCGVDFA
ncbi:enolase C-terminal domain-like protein [Piscinibacter sp. XHJ-5]|uniref:mandelate racemase/muconate lactonizing enzyme family protein n=1 Tax=Piscinibacter sp. XHJ-5 TaxID=3037797 RepID=UPI00245298C1|nr:enolase C-terminal domain-like protein [Piscinibacter sp. XHJ-5]